MVLPIWIILVICSLGVSLAAFLWGLNSGQFSDQERARYLPLRDPLPPPPVQNPSGLSIEIFVFLFIGLLVFAGLGISILLNFIR